MQGCEQGQSPVSGRALTHHSLCWGDVNWGCRTETLAKKKKIPPNPQCVLSCLLPPQGSVPSGCADPAGVTRSVSPKGTGTFCTFSSKPPPVCAGRGQRLSAPCGLSLKYPSSLCCSALLCWQKWCQRLCSACTDTVEGKASKPSPHPLHGWAALAGGFQQHHPSVTSCSCVCLVPLPGDRLGLLPASPDPQPG